MNRQIKFRVWHKKQKRMLIVSNIECNIKGIIFGIDTYINLVENYDRQYSDIEEINLMQFTGLLDKNGKDIFEGDIIKAEVINSFSGDKNLNKVIIRIVSYYETQCSFAFGAYNPLNLFNIEVIGNIHDNPELLGENYESNDKESK
jgi:phage uncharacterized protein TIGR01671